MNSAKKYVRGGVQGVIGEPLTIEVPAQQAAPAQPAPADGPVSTTTAASDPSSPTPQSTTTSQPAQPAAAASGRTRMSIWCFNAPFIKVGSTLDDAILDKVRDSRVDDVSLVNTLAPPDSNWAPGGVVKGTAVSWSDGFLGGFGSLRDPVLKGLVSGLHSRGVQIMLGYCIGNSNDPGGAGNAYAKNFVNWLQAMSEDQVKAHAKAIADFVKQYGADGIGFDLELSAMGEPHRANIKTLYSTVASELQSVNGLVSYANAPFTSKGHIDGTPAMSGMQIQDFDLARDIPNLVARPMCYDTNALDYDLIGRCVDWALGGAGLTPAKLQLGLYACDPNPHGKGGTAASLAFIQSTMQPKRVGMIHYQVPPGKWTGQKMDNSAAATALGHVSDFEAALNPGEDGPGKSGAPLQVPRQ